MEKKDENTTIEGSEAPVLVFITAVEVKEEPKRELLSQRQWMMLLSALLVIAFLAILWLSSVQYDQTIQSQLSGSYTMTRDLISIPESLSSPIDESYNLQTGIITAGDGGIMVVLSLASRMGNPSGSYEDYQIERVVLEGKKTKQLNVDEKIIPGTSVVAVFSDPNLELGHTLNLEITVNKNSSTSSAKHFFYNVEILRVSSNGKIYFVQAKEDMKQEPGFEVVMAISAMMIIAIAIRRKKE